MNDQLAKWERVSKPGDFHKKLDALTGEWTYKGYYWPNGFDAPPVIDQGQASIKWINDSRFILMEGSGTQMGAPFSFLSLLGYNNNRKKFTSVWTDNSTTAMFNTVGNMDDKEEHIYFYGTSDDPGSDELDKQWTLVLTFEKSKEFRFEYFDISKGQDTKLFAIVFTKK